MPTGIAVTAGVTRRIERPGPREPRLSVPSYTYRPPARSLPEDVRPSIFAPPNLAES